MQLYEIIKYIWCFTIQSVFILNHLIFSITSRATQAKDYYSHCNDGEMMLRKVKIQLT